MYTVQIASSETPKQQPSCLRRGVDRALSKISRGLDDHRVIGGTLVAAVASAYVSPGTAAILLIGLAGRHIYRYGHPQTPMAISVCRQTLEKVGGSHTPTKRNRKDVDLIARTVMRYPNQKAKKALYQLHKVISSRFQTHNDFALKWLIEGASRDARGRFKDAASFRQFINTDPAHLSPSRLMTGLSTVMHAISYRAMRSDKGLEPIFPIPGFLLNDINDLIQIVHKYVVSDHSSRYPDSRDCVVEQYDAASSPKQDQDEDHFLAPLRDELSDVSDSEDNQPTPRICGQLYRKTGKGGKKTWVGVAKMSGVDVRASISASALLCLAAIEAFLAPERTINSVCVRRKLKLLDTDTLSLLAGTLIIPTYHRADYHSIAETGAAVQHYLAERAGQKDAVLTPRQAFAKGLDLMTQCVDAPYQEPARELSKATLATTREVPFAVQ